MSVRQTLDFLLDEADRREAMPNEWRMETEAVITFCCEMMGNNARGFFSIYEKRLKRYRGLPIVETEPGTGITLRTIV